jgi:tetratricopeptide (TPR) repeat protein
MVKGKSKHREHATTRYQRLEAAQIDDLQKAYRRGDDLRGVATWLSLESRRVIVAETLDADRIVRFPPRQLAQGEVDLGVLTDFKAAAVAEIVMAELASEGGAGASGLEARSRVLLAEAGRSPTASPALEYEPIYRDLAEAALLREDRAALDWLRRALAHDLRYYDGDDALFQLVDLASAHLQLGDLDQGLTMLTKLLREDPANIWIYRFMATGFGVLGLVEIGQRAALRGLEILDALDVGDDEEDLHDDLLMARVELGAGPKQGRETEVSDEVLDNLYRSMAAVPVSAGSGLSRPMAALCRDLVEDFDAIPVKRRLTVDDLPEAVRALL